MIKKKVAHFAFIGAIAFVFDSATYFLYLSYLENIQKEIILQYLVEVILVQLADTTSVS